MRVLAAIWMFLLASAAPAQTEADPRRAELDEQVCKLLLQFARHADVQRLPSRARQAYQLVLEHYDEEQPAARKQLGFRKVDGEWQAVEGFEFDADRADASRIRRVERAWDKACEKACELHREFGQALDAEGHRARAVAQFERALAFCPDDEVSHLALGHVEFEGFFGTEEQVATARRMREIRAFATSLRERDYEVEDLPPERLPATLQKSGLEFCGVRSEHFTHWYTGTREGAHDGIKWAERAWDLLGFLLQDDAAQRLPNTRKWFARLKTRAEQIQMLSNAPESRGEYTMDIAKLFSTSDWLESGGRVEFGVMWHRNEADTVVGHVANRNMPRSNEAFEEGLVHVCTWLLCGTTKASYIALPKTVAGGFEPLGNDPDQWRRRLQDQIEQGNSWPLRQLPRERRDHFRPEARLKAWSFLAFLIARYPDTWHQTVRSFGKASTLTVEDVEAKFREATGRDIAELESEWRQWARRGSRWGQASGL